MVTNRDGFIDSCKGFLILWVIQIHTVFWSYIPGFFLELSLLIDVSLFFFISGYLTKVSDLGILLRKSLKQFKNLYSDYLILSCFLLVPLGGFYWIKERSTPDLVLAIFSMLRVHPVGDLWEDLLLYHGSLWYMAVYFSLLPIIPFLISKFDSCKLRIIILTTVLTLFVIFSNLGWNYPFLFTGTIYILFYLFIFLLGAAYRIDEQYVSSRYLRLTFLINLTVCLLLFFFVMGGTLQLNNNKFPPSVTYLPYSLLLIHVFAMLKRMSNYASIPRPNHLLQFLEWCGKNSYSVYLMQGIVCSLPGYIIPLLLKNDIPVWGVYVVSLLFNLSFTLLLTFIWSRSKTVLANSFATITSSSKSY